MVNSTGILHLLYQLSGSNQGNEVAGGVLESVFNNKVMNKVDYSA